MEPADTAGEDGFPLKISRLELGRGFVAAVVENNGGTHPLAAVTIDGSHVRALDTVVLEMLVERPHTHGAHSFSNEVTDGIIYHGGSDSGLQSEAICQIGSNIEFPAADMDLTLMGFSEGHDARVEAVDEGAERQEVEGAGLGDVEAVVHSGIMLSCRGG